MSGSSKGDQETASQRKKKRSGPLEVNGIKLVKNSQNVFSKRYNAVSFSTPRNRKPKKMQVSHSQLFSLCSMLICNDGDRLEFLKICKESYRCKNGSIPSVSPFACIDGGIDFGENKISMTPVWFIDYCLRQSSTSIIGWSKGKTSTVLPSSIAELGKAFNDVYLIEGLINTHSRADIRGFNQHNNVVHHVKGLQDKKAKLSDVILYLPSAGIFYSRYAPAVASSSKTSNGASSDYHPLDASWLRVRRDNGQVAKGGFLSAITRVHRIVISPAPTAVLDCHHVPDTAIPLPPDSVKTAVNMSLPSCIIPQHNRRYRQEAYAAALLRSGTNKALSKRTAVGYLYTNPEGANGNKPLVINPKQGEVCLRVLTKLSDIIIIHSKISSYSRLLRKCALSSPKRDRKKSDPLARVCDSTSGRSHQHYLI